MKKYIDRDALVEYAHSEYGILTESEIRQFPTSDVQPVEHNTEFNELSSILQDYDIKDTDTLRYILDQYQKIIVGITGGVLSKLVYPAKTVIEQAYDNYHKCYEELINRGHWVKGHCGVDEYIKCSVCRTRIVNTIVSLEGDVAEDYFDLCPKCGARIYGDKDNNVRNLTDEETTIYESWVEGEAKDTGLNIMDGDSK